MWNTWGVLINRCSENMQQVYWRTSMLKREVVFLRESWYLNAHYDENIHEDSNPCDFHNNALQLKFQLQCSLMEIAWIWIFMDVLIIVFIRASSLSLKTTPPSFLPTPSPLLLSPLSPSSTWKLSGKFLVKISQFKFLVMVKKNIVV